MQVFRTVAVIVLGAAVVPFGAAQEPPDGTLATVAAVDRSTLGREVIAKWRDTAIEKGLDLRAWETDMQRVVERAGDGKLLAAASAASWDEAARFLGAAGTNAIGAEATDLVYIPLAPCRILDTRLGTGGFAGPLASNSTTAVAHNQNLTAQGGNAAGCGVPTDPAAIVATVTVVPAVGPGDLRIYATGSTLPLASVINYAAYAGLNLANTTTIPTGQILGYDFNIHVDGAATHVVVDVAGYFWKPRGSIHAVVENSATFDAARTNGFSTVTRPATGVYCLTPSDASITPATTAYVVSVDYGKSSGGNNGMAATRATSLECPSASQFEVHTFASGVASNSIAFQLIVP
jgi:hypothetical protein